MDLAIFSQVIVNGILTGGLYALIAVGLTLIFGVMRVINFVHGETLMLGSYLTYFLFTLLGIDPFISLPLAIFALFVLGVAIQHFFINPVLDTPHLNQILLTFGLVLIIQNLALILWSGNYISMTTRYSAISLKFGPLSVGLTRFLGLVIAIFLTVLLTVVLKRTEWGKSVRAVTQDREAAMLMGIDVNRVNMVAFGVGSAMGGAAGVVTSMIMYVFPLVGMIFVLKAFAIVVLGGFGSIGGAVLGSLILGLTESIVTNYVPNGSGWAEGVSFVVMILILVIRPKGLIYVE
ncbi:MAG TPA: branched-chain amino acid ABC transporter permease [Thermodesulfobacteriota bacterium]|nr:branched-chain amino acid ABC transporter permease [Thermodesulfobacteriota bacterium]